MKLTNRTGIVYPRWLYLKSYINNITYNYYIENIPKYKIKLCKKLFGDNWLNCYKKYF